MTSVYIERGYGPKYLVHGYVREGYPPGNFKILNANVCILLQFYNTKLLLEYYSRVTGMPIGEPLVSPLQQFLVEIEMQKCGFSDHK